MQQYHDSEWGRPVRDERGLFERLCLEGFQSGLSWAVILRKRPAFRDAFAGFEPEVVAQFDESDVERLLGDAAIVRHRGKIEAAINNARATCALHGRLPELLWSFAPSDPPVPQSVEQIPSSTPESTAMARELKSLGFRFVGPTTAYALMQAVGMVDDHVSWCGWRARAGSHGR